MSAPNAMFQAPPDPGGSTDDWLITWADAMSLLLGFFVLLFSVSEIDNDRFARVAEALSSRTEVDEEIPSVVAEVMTGREIVDRVTGTLQPMIDTGSVQVEKLPTGVRIAFDADAIFDGPGTQMRPAVSPILTTLAWEMRQRDMQHYLIEVLAAPDWEIAGARAVFLARFFDAQGIGSERLRATAFGDSDPRIRVRRGGDFGRGKGGRIILMVERL
jgi:chemotaxis protein MotB